MATFREFTYPSSDGVHNIYACQWLPDGGQPRAVVQIVHGVSEYVGRYDHVARRLADAGYVVCGEDHLGHGNTAKADSKFGYFGKHDGWTLVTADVRQLRILMGEQFPDIPYIMLGHSMGSFLTRTYLCRYPSTIDGAILSGTGQEPAALVACGKAIASLIGRIKGMDTVSPLVHALSLGAYNKQFAPNRTTADWISRDEAVVDAYLKDPFCSVMPAVGLYRDMLGGLQYIASKRALSQMDPGTPIYIFSGDKDPVGSSGEGVRKVHGYFQTYGTHDLTLKLYPDGRHEMFNELNRDEVIADLLAWLEAHT